jgi:hypothetical protein
MTALARPGTGRIRLASPVTATALGAVVVVLLAAAVSLAAMAHDLTVSNLVTLISVCLAFTAVGVVVARHQPRNPVAWLLATVGLLTVLNSVGAEYEVLVYRLGHGTWPLGPLAVFLELAWAPLIILLPLAILLFPDAQLPSPRSRALLRAYLVLGAVYLAAVWAAAGQALTHRHLSVDPGGGLTAIDQPAGWFALTQQVILIAYVVFWVVFVGRQVMSWRHADGERRQQLKWLISGSALCVLGGVTIVLGAALSSNANPVVANTVTSVATVALAALPVGVGVGILKYRLYEIDRIISRTLAYAIVTGLLVGVYAGLVLLATQVLKASSPVSVAASTLAAAALFNPLRRRVQRVVDRRFNRARYDADRTVAAFAGRLQDAVDLGTARADLVGTVQQALEPAHATLWLREAER